MSLDVETGEARLSEAAQISLALVPKFTAALSIMGSGWIILEVWGDRDRRSLVYHRILYAFSQFDVMTSSWYFLSSWPIPRGTANVWNAVGNTASCVAQGFFVQLGSAMFVYNAVLATYFVMVIRFSVKEETLKNNEIYLHIGPILFGVGTAVTGLALDLYNEANLWCWIAPFPEGCKHEQLLKEFVEDEEENKIGNCTRGQGSYIFRWLFYYSPLWTCFLIVAFGLYSVYRGVKINELKAARYDPSQTRIPITSSVAPASSSQEEGSHVNGSSGGSTAIGGASSKHTNSGPASSFRAAQSCRPEEGARVTPRNTVGSFAQYVSTRITEKLGQGSIRTPKARQVASQAMLYILAFYVTYVFGSISRIIQQFNGTSPYVLKLLQAFFTPLQGTLNFLIYRRPVFLRIRRQNPNMPLRRAIVETFKFNENHRWRQKKQSTSSLASGTTLDDARTRLNALQKSITGRIALIRSSDRPQMEKDMLVLEEMEVIGTGFNYGENSPPSSPPRVASHAGTNRDHRDHYDQQNSDSSLPMVIEKSQNEASACIDDDVAYHSGTPIVEVNDEEDNSEPDDDKKSGAGKAHMKVSFEG